MCHIFHGRLILKFLVFFVKINCFNIGFMKSLFMQERKEERKNFESCASFVCLKHVRVMYELCSNTTLVITTLNILKSLLPIHELILFCHAVFARNHTGKHEVSVPVNTSDQFRHRQAYVYTRPKKKRRI